MKDLQTNDKVYCPALSTKPFLTYTNPYRTNRVLYGVPRI